MVLNSEMIDSDGEIWINFNHNQQDVPEWVVVRDDLTIPSKMVCKYDVRLVLCDGATLTVNSGVVCDAGRDTTSRLTIYGQANDTGIVNSYTFIDLDAKTQKEEKPVELPFLPVD